MKETNGILVIGPGDLTEIGREKRTKYVEYTDIAFSLEPFRHAAIVLFVNDEKRQMKVMKSKYQVVT